jgi:S-adenosylmethionine hydrolase
MARFDTISFLSDYGTADEFVGVVKSVVRDLAAHVMVIDLTHEIPPHDVRAGSLALARCAQYLVPGVLLAVVDPGVGTERRAVAVEVVEGRAVFVGPDNGLLASAVAMTGGADRAVALTNDAYHLPAPGPTFAGRDVFAPVAAHLCNGVDLAELGEAVDPAGLLPTVLPLSRPEGRGVGGEVLWVDRYGNVQLNVDPDEVAHLGERVLVRWGGGTRSARWARTYGDIRPGEVGLVVDSYGLVSLAVDRHSAAAELDLEAGDGVTIEALDETGDQAVPVRLGRHGRGRP